MTKNTIYGLLFCLLLVVKGQAQIDSNSALYKDILSRDSLLFTVGFNSCAVEQFEQILSEKFEFYHDKEGISDRNKFLKNLRSGLCENPTQFQARRELIPGTTKIYALKKNGELYGALQEGIHQFFEKQPGSPETFGSSARFTHLWLIEEGKWKLSKSYSFEHQLLQLSNSPSNLFDSNAEIEKWLKDMHVPTLGIGVIEEGKLKHVNVFGEISTGISAPYNTIFNVASLTKPITTMVVLKLISKGEWRLDEPLFHYWTDPDVINDPRNKKLTTRHVLTHQTGFPNWRFANDSTKLFFYFEPGSKYQYAGEGFEYLRNALEKKFNKTLDQLAAELLFDKLDMGDTHYFWDNTIDVSRVAIPYNSAGKPYEMVKRNRANGADDLYTSIEDYSNFLVSVLNSDGLTKQVHEEMIRHQVATTNGKHFGLGFEIYNFKNGNFALSHGGSDEGVQTIFFIFPNTKKGLVIFTNVDDGHKVYEKIIAHYLGEEGNEIIEIETGKKSN